MRLTLRTLLAHLDQILDEPDAEELEKKIRESELATQLVHRIRSVLGQRRLTALSVHTRGLGRDANSVAEYLDNTLPTEQIPDFERVCLESDIHLSEVAACHQILTLVLGEPATIPEGLKEKIYRLQDRPWASASPEAAVAPPAGEPASEDEGASEDDVLSHLLQAGPSSAAPDSGPPIPLLRQPETDAAPAWDEDEHWTEAPDYLKRPRSGRWKSVAIAAAIAFCLTLAGLRGMGPLDRNHPLARRFGWFPTEELASAPTPTKAGTSGTGEPEPAGGGEASPPTITPGEIEPSLIEPAAAPTTEVVDESEGPDRVAADEPREEAVAGEGLDASVEEDAEPPFDFVPPTDAPPPATTPPAAELTDATDTELPDAADIEDRAPAPLEAELPDFAPNADDIAADDSTPDPEAQEGDRAAVDDFPAIAPDPQTPPGPESELATDPSADGPRLVNPLATNLNGGREPAEVIPPLPTPRRPTEGEAAGLDTAIDNAVGSDLPPEPPAPPVVDIGRFLDTEQVLVKWDPEAELWGRVPVGTRLQVGDLLMSLPTYRSPLVLASGMQVSLIGGTRIEVLDPDVASTPYFRLEFGRLTVATFAQSGTTFGLQWAADHSGAVTLDDINTTLAISLQPEYLPGADPETSPPHQVLHIYVTSGSAEWDADQTPTIRIGAGQRLTLIDDYPAILKDIAEQPTWIDGRDARPRDPIAARELAQRLTPDRPVTLVLKEEADSRRFEVRSLAVCSLAYLGDFDPLLVALNDPKLRVYWPAQYEVLARAPSFSPEFMASVKQSIVQRHGEEEGKNLFRMLWGFSPEQLADGSAADLLDYLDHPSYDFRIVANELLKSITGQPSLYRANAGDRDPQRRAAVSRWRKMLDNGEIGYERPPELAELLNEAAPNP